LKKEKKNDIQEVPIIIFCFELLSTNLVFVCQRCHFSLHCIILLSFKNKHTQKKCDQLHPVRQMRATCIKNG